MMIRLLVLSLFVSTGINGCRTDQAIPQRSFVIVVKPAGNTNTMWKAQTLDSIFDQTFSDFRVIYLCENAEGRAFVEKYRVATHLQDRLSLIENASLESVIKSHCHEHEAIILREDDEWFCHQDSLESLIKGI